MKKITLHLLLLVFAGYGMVAQNLLTNGDFESGQVDWIGNAFNVQTDGGNSFNFANVETAGNPFDVNLSQVVEIVMGQTYTLTFDAGTDDATGSRTMIAGIGLNEGPFTADIETVTLASGALQTFTLTFTASFGLPNSRVLFDMGADTGVIVIDNVSLEVDDSGSTFDDGLLTNGDFQEGMVVWEGNGFNVQSDSGNNFNFVDVETAGNPFDVNLSQRGIDITEGQEFTLSFDASTDATTGSRTMLAGIGLFVDPFTNQSQEVTITSETQTFELTLVANFTSADSRVLFDMGAATGIVVIDNVSLFLNEDGDDPVPPTVAAPVPPAREDNAVISIYSDAYTDIPNVIFGAFNVGTLDITPLVVEGDNLLQIGFVQPDPGFLLVDWGALVDATAMTHFHMDIWVDTDLTTGLVVNPILSNHVGDVGETSNFGLTNPVSAFGEWISVDVPLTDFDFGTTAGEQQRDALRQFVMTVAGADTGARTVFLDNLYLHNDTVLSTEEFNLTSVKAFPNPSNGQWIISSANQTIVNVTLYDVLGRKVVEQEVNNNEVTVDASNLSKGMFVATVTTTTGTQSIKLIKN